MKDLDRPHPPPQHEWSTMRMVIGATLSAEAFKGYGRSVDRHYFQEGFGYEVLTPVGLVRADPSGVNSSHLIIRCLLPFSALRGPFCHPCHLRCLQFPASSILSVHPSHPPRFKGILPTVVDHEQTLVIEQEVKALFGEGGHRERKSKVNPGSIASIS